MFAAFESDGRLDLFALPRGERLLALPPPRAMRFQDVCFNATGDRMYLLRGDGRVYEWNVAELRNELVLLGLDWNSTEPRKERSLFQSLNSPKRKWSNR